MEQAAAAAQLADVQNAVGDCQKIGVTAEERRVRFEQEVRSQIVNVLLHRSQPGLGAASLIEEAAKLESYILAGRQPGAVIGLANA